MTQHKQASPSLTPAQRVWGLPELDQMHGFLPLRAPKRPEKAFAPVDQLLEKMPVILNHDQNLETSGLLAKNQFRQQANTLPDLSDLILKYRAELDSDQTPEARKNALADTLAHLFRDYQYLKMGYLFEPIQHGASQAESILPAPIAHPLMLLANTFNRHPWLEYASGYVIMNSDFTLPITPHNITLIRQWHGGPDEYYFQSIHSVIEHKTPELFCALSALIRGIEQGGETQIKNAMASGIAVTEKIFKTLRLMPKLSRPAYYSADVRPQIQGLTGNTGEGKLFDSRGVFFEDCGQDTYQGRRGQWLNDIRGQTGAQSSIIPLLDNFLGITDFYEPGDNPLTAMLRAFRHYRPQPHVDLLENIEAQQASLGIRNNLKALAPLQLAHWTHCVCQFREFHYFLAMAYIIKPGLKHQPPSQSRNIGTGGSPTPSYLPQHVRETLHALVDALDAVNTQNLSPCELKLYQRLRQSSEKINQDNNKRASTVGLYLDGNATESELDIALSQARHSLSIPTS